MYNYTKDPVNTDQLTGEIQASAIVTALDYMETVGDQLNIYFKATLSSGDEDILDGLVEDHVAQDSEPEAMLVTTELQKDPEDAPMMRLKYAPTGWTYQAHCFEVETSKLSGVYSKKPDGTDTGFCSIKFYKANGDEITSGVQLDLTLYCVKTRVIWEPNHSFALISGQVRNLDSITQDTRLSVIAAPHIAAEYGGSKVFIQQLNLKSIGQNEELRTDGRASKHIEYDTTYYSHRFHFDFTHSAGVQKNHLIILEFYKA